MTPGGLYEVLNGSSVAPIVLLQIWMIRYLAKEARKYGLRWWSWAHLPVHMDLALAMFVFDTGVLAEAVGLTAGGFLIAVGALCKIRALTRPEWGNLQWLVASAITASAAAMLLLLMLLR